MTPEEIKRKNEEEWQKRDKAYMQRRFRELAPLFEEAMKNHKPKPTSGLVEMQKYFMNFAEKQRANQNKPE